jgi:hypothetical protein
VDEQAKLSRIQAGQDSGQGLSSTRILYKQDMILDEQDRLTNIQAGQDSGQGLSRR